MICWSLITHMHTHTHTHTPHTPQTQCVKLSMYPDPAHVPFAHHGVMGSRALGTPMAIEIDDEAGTGTIRAWYVYATNQQGGKPYSSSERARAEKEEEVVPTPRTRNQPTFVKQQGAVLEAVGRRQGPGTACTHSCTLVVGGSG